jgi:signal transduction histidine kinase
MDDVLSLFDRKIRITEVTVTKDYETDVAVDAMPGEIRQVLSNLLANALDAAGKKGKLRIRVSRARNWAARGGRGVRVSIADNGVGIAPPNREHLFEPFFTTKGAKGTGLGLWVTRGMIEKHTGNIRVWSSTSPSRRGTVFSIFLPLKQKRSTMAGPRRVN